MCCARHNLRTYAACRALVSCSLMLKTYLCKKRALIKEQSLSFFFSVILERKSSKLSITVISLSQDICIPFLILNMILPLWITFIIIQRITETNASSR